MIDVWDQWLGQLALSGVDPRGWDLNRLLAAYEAQVRNGAKDDADWKRMQSLLTAEPPEVRRERRRAVAAGRAPAQQGAGRMSVDDAEAMIARMMAADAAYG